LTPIAYIKRLTSIPGKFIDELFRFYETNTSQTDFVIDIDAVATWLSAHKRTLMATLRSGYKNGFDYITVKEQNPHKKDPRNNNYTRCMITPDCFKRICMMSRAKNAEMVRTYFIEVEALFLKHRDQLLDGLKRDVARLEMNQKRKTPIKGLGKEGYIYVFKASQDADNLYKLGRTRDMRTRLSNHQSSRADNIDVLFEYKASNIYAVETCVKAFLKQHQYRKYKEIYNVDLDYVKRLVYH